MSQSTSLAIVAARVRAARWARIAGGLCASVLGLAAFVRAWLSDVERVPNPERWLIFMTVGDPWVLRCLAAALPVGAVAAAVTWLWLRPRRDQPVDLASALGVLRSARSLTRASVWWPLLGVTLVGPLMVHMPAALGGGIFHYDDFSSAAHGLIRGTSHLHVVMIVVAAGYVYVADEFARPHAHAMVGVIVCACLSVCYPGWLLGSIDVVPRVLVAGSLSLVPAYLLVHHAVVNEAKALSEAEVEAAPFH